MKRFVALLLLAVIGSPICKAGDQAGRFATHFTENGNEFRVTCRAAAPGDPDPSFAHGMCLEYVVGVSDGIRLVATIAQPDRPYCLPDGVTNGQILDVVIHFTEDHPEIRHYQVRELVLYSLIKAFPCHAAK